MKPTVLDGDRVVDALKMFVRELNDVVVSINIIQEIYSTQNVGVDEFKISCVVKCCQINIFAYSMFTLIFLA